jgi:voltage-gated potassium channel
MLKYALIGTVIVTVTIIIHAIGTLSLVRELGRRYADKEGDFRSSNPLRVLIGIVLVFFALHTIEIIVWACVYWFLLPANSMGSFEEATYFSFITFTTLGYGDITLAQGWRLLGGIESLNGIILVGLTTAMLFAILSRMWHGIVIHNPEQTDRSV